MSGRRKMNEMEGKERRLEMFQSLFSILSFGSCHLPPFFLFFLFFE
jgi:formate hydrogenlyase subunit 3/multisubunit Na+/H+ antiporter MnhD subunit